jgi:hypothetical protein
MPFAVWGLSMTFTSVSTPVHTRTQTATHLADVVLGSIADILGTLGINATQVFADWDQDQRAITNWIVEGSLASVALEYLSVINPMERSHPSSNFRSPIWEVEKVTGSLPRTVPRWLGILPNCNPFPWGPFIGSFAPTAAHIPSSQPAVGQVRCTLFSNPTLWSPRNTCGRSPQRLSPQSRLLKVEHSVSSGMSWPLHVLGRWWRAKNGKYPPAISLTCLW